jgi:cytoskeletal protein CcmA (bactofilin family)
MSHFDEMTCMLYLDGQLDAVRAVELREHIRACTPCRTLLGVLQRESALLESALLEEDESVPARLLSAPRRESVQWAWVASAGLASLGTYTLWTKISEWSAPFNQVGIDGGGLLTMLFAAGAFWRGWGDLMTILQFTAIATLLAVGLPFLYRSLRRWKLSPMVICALLGLLALPSAAHAAEIRRAQNLTLPAGETVKNDLIIFGATVRIDGTVEGDLITFARTVTVTGRVTGDIIGFAQKIRIEGQVDGDVRIFTNGLDLVGKVEKNVMAFGQGIDFGSKSEIGGSLTVFGQQSSMDGRVGRDVMGFFESGQINGFVGGSVNVEADSLAIGSTAEVRGKTRVKAKKRPEVAEGAKLASPLEYEQRTRKPRYTEGGFYLGHAIRWGVSFVFGLVVLLLMPAFFRETVRSSNRYGPALGLGLVSFVSVPALAVVACITIVGIAVGIGAVLLYAIALYSAKVVVGTWLGQRLLGEEAGTAGLLGRMALGLVILRILSEIPHVGFFVTLAYLFWGLGAITLAVYNRLNPPLVVSPAAATVPAS